MEKPVTDALRSFCLRPNNNNNNNNLINNSHSVEEISNRSLKCRKFFMRQYHKVGAVGLVDDAVRLATATGRPDSS